MEKQHLYLIELFIKNNGDWLNGKLLSQYLNVTTRTVRNYISKINEYYPNLIKSSNLGYRISITNYEYYKKKINQFNKKQLNRKSKILLEIIKHSERGVDLFELSNSLYISESTLLSDIQAIRNELPNDLNIRISDEKITMIGTERNKRKYIISLLYNEKDIFNDFKDSINEIIGYISLDSLTSIVENEINKAELFTNYYQLTNIVLHLAIMVERLRQGNISNYYDLNLEEYLNDFEYNIAHRITDKISDLYDIKFPRSEILQFSLQFIGLEKKQSERNHIKSLNEYVDEDIINILENTINKVERTYLIDLSDKDFFERLAVHLQNLYYRSKFEVHIRNSNLLDIKINYPVIYDISVYLTSIIQNELKININEDEIAFIALHIGTLLDQVDEKNNNVGIINIKILTHQYHNLDEQIKKTLASKIQEEVTIGFIETKEEVNKVQFDLLLTTDNKIAKDISSSILINPILTKENLININNSIHQIKKEKEKEYYNYLINKYFDENLFEKSYSLSNKNREYIMQYLNDKMVRFDYVDNSYIKEITLREKMSPTSFPSGAAVPHALKFKGIKSGISLLLLNEPVQWANYEVRLIALISISQNDSHDFNYLFEKFIEVISEQYNVNKLANCNSYSQFIQTLKLMLNKI